MPTSMRTWWDIFWWSTFEGQELLHQDIKAGAIVVGAREQKKTLRQFEKNLKKRLPVQKRLHKDCQGFFADTPCQSFAYGGITIDPGTHQVRFTEDKMMVVLVNLETNDSMEVTSQDEVAGIINFILFYRSQAVGDGGETEDPNAFVRAVLESRGITKENFWTHPKSPKQLVHNPWGDETDDGKIIRP